jgi:hypothetical protein
MKPNRVFACVIASSFLLAVAACVTAPFESGTHGDGYGNHDSGEHLNNLRDPSHWNDAGDHSEREQSRLNSKSLELSESAQIHHAIYFLPPIRRQSSAFWA